MINKLLRKYRKTFWSVERFARYSGVKIGNNCSIQDVSFGSEPYLIEVGNHVQITSGVKIFTHGGGWVFREKNPNLDYFGKVVIRDNVYIGNNSMIMPGLIIGCNVIIGAGSVVTKSVNDGDIVAGNPARIIGKTSEYEMKIKKYDVQAKKLNYDDKKSFLLNLKDDKFIKK